MATTVKKYLIDGSSLVDGPDGYFLVEHWLIEGLAKTPADTVYWRAIQARGEDNESLIPAKGSKHPGMSRFFLERRQFAPYHDARDRLTVKLFWRDLATVKVRVNGVLQRDSTRLDYQGQLLKSQYKAGLAANAVPTGDGVETCIHEVPIVVPGTLVEFERASKAEAGITSIEQVTPSRFPPPFVLGTWFQGKCNSTTWQNQPARTWICENVSGYPLTELVPGRDHYWMYQFAFRFVGYTRNGIVNTVDPIMVYRSQTGYCPSEINPSVGLLQSPPLAAANGWKRGQVLEAAEFGRLGLKRIWDPTSPDAPDA